MHVHRQGAARLVSGLVMWAAFGAGAATQGVAGPADPAKVPRVSAAELRRLMKQDQAIAVDVRSAEAFAAGHIVGAIHVPASEIRARALDIRARAGSRRVVLYCSCPFEHSAAEAALELYRLGFLRVAVLAGGYGGRGPSMAR